ncbi:thiolase family protein [Novosphingobium colocasiae]
MRNQLRGAQSAARAGRPGWPRGGEPAFAAPFGCFSPANWLALYAGAYCHRYQVDPEFLGTIVSASRAQAARNPLALQREPLTLDGYRASRIISTPLRLADCDMPCDGAKAVVVSARQTAPDLRGPAVRVLALGSRMAEPQSWDQGTLTHQPQVFGAAAHMWSRTDLTPDDIDVAMLYDGFSFNLVSWLEALGFCAPGEAAAFIGDGSRIGPGGTLPVNTDGGHLSAGRSNGWGHLIEAVQQLRGDAGARQVRGARTAVVTTGGAIPAGCCLLQRN